MTKLASVKQEDPTIRRSFLSKDLVTGPARFPQIQTVADGAPPPTRAAFPSLVCCQASEQGQDVGLRPAVGGGFSPSSSR